MLLELLLYQRKGKASLLVVVGENGASHLSLIRFVVYALMSISLLVSDRTLKVWSMDDPSDNLEERINLKAKAVVAAHDKDINSLAIAPNDSLVCSGSQVRI